MSKKRARELKAFIEELDPDHLNAHVRKESEMVYGRPQLDKLQHSLGNISANLSGLVDYIEELGGSYDLSNGSGERRGALLALTSLITCMLNNAIRQETDETEAPPVRQSFSEYLRNLTPDEMSSHYRRMSHLMEIEMSRSGKSTIELLLSDMKEAYPGAEQLSRDIFISFDNSEGFSEDFSVGAMSGALLALWMLKGLAETHDFSQSIVAD